jgi:acyl-CoA thioester hydrolase
MPLITESSFRIRHYECDAYGHVNNANYLRYMQEAAFEASAAAGYDVARYQVLKRIWYVRESDITFLRPLAYGESVSVKTWVSDFRRIHCHRAYELFEQASGDIVARASTDWVFLDADSTRPPLTGLTDLLRRSNPENDSPKRRNRLPGSSPCAGRSAGVTLTARAM